MSEEFMQEEQEEEVAAEQILGCWFDHIRVCGPDCTAYDDRCRDNPVFNPCLILNIGRSLTVSLSGIDKAYGGMRKQAANEELRKLADIPPPSVRP